MRAINLPLIPGLLDSGTLAEFAVPKAETISILANVCDAHGRRLSDTAWADDVETVYFEIHDGRPEDGTPLASSSIDADDDDFSPGIGAADMSFAFTASQLNQTIPAGEEYRRFYWICYAQLLDDTQRHYGMGYLNLWATNTAFGVPPPPEVDTPFVTEDEMQAALDALEAELQAEIDAIEAELGEVVTLEDKVKGLRPIAWYGPDSSAQIDSAATPSVIEWFDGTGLGNHATGTPGSRPGVDLTPVNNRLGVQFSDLLELSLPDPPLTVSWAVVVAKLTDATTHGCVLAKSDSTQWWMLGQATTALPWTFGIGAAAGETILGGRRTPTINTPHIYTLRNLPVSFFKSIAAGGTPNPRLFGMGIDGYDWLNRGDDVDFTPGILGGLSGFTYDFRGTIYEVLLGAPGLDQAGLDDALEYLAGRWSITLDAGKRAFFVGDSITIGQSPANAGNSYPAQLIGVQGGAAGFTDSNWTGLNLGIGGWRCHHTHFDAVPRTLISRHCTRNVAVVWIGTNDLSAGMLAADVLPLVAAVCKRWLDAGAEVVLMPCADRSDSDITAQRALYNAGLANFVSQGKATYFLDPLLVPEIFADGASANVTYFQDLVHPTTAGNALIAEALYDNIFSSL